MKSAGHRIGAGDLETHLGHHWITGKQSFCFRGSPWLCEGEMQSHS